MGLTVDGLRAGDVLYRARYRPAQAIERVVVVDRPSEHVVRLRGGGGPWSASVGSLADAGYATTPEGAATLSVQSWAMSVERVERTLAETRAHLAEAEALLSSLRSHE